MEKLNAIENDLTCPLSLELFEDPIQVPCCQKGFSRMHLHQAVVSGGPKCPLCNGDLSRFNVLEAPKNLLLAGMVDIIKRERPAGPPAQKWRVTVTPLLDDQSVKTSVAEFRLSLENSRFKVRPTLFIAVVDRSGSMSGAPWRQVETALLHMLALTKDNPNVKFVIVAYDSNAQSYPMTGIHEHNLQTIRTMFTGGGTMFTAAYAKVRDVLAEHVCEDDISPDNVQRNVSSATIAFMTDGQPGEPVDTLPGLLRDMLVQSWRGPVTVHTVGFGGGCNRDLLEKMRVCGTTEGTYRYAEPGDDGDTLCNKLTSLFEMAAKSSTVSLRIKWTGAGGFRGLAGQADNAILETQFPVGQDGRGTLSSWLVGVDDLNCEVVVDTPLDVGLRLKPVVDARVSSPNMRRLYQSWLGAVVDSLASDAMKIAAMDRANADLYRLHCDLFGKRVDAVMRRVTDDAVKARLQHLAVVYEQLRSGAVINLNRLADLRYASLFGPDAAKAAAPAIQHQAAPAAPAVMHEQEYREPYAGYSRNPDGKNRNDLQNAICALMTNKRTPLLTSLINGADASLIQHLDADGNNALMLAAYCGHNYALQDIISKMQTLGIPLNLDYENPGHESAVTLAVKSRGFWRSLTTLLDAGATIPEHRRRALYRYAIDKEFTTTAELVNGAAGGASLDVNASMTPQFITYTVRKGLAVEFDQARVAGYLLVCAQKNLLDLANEILQHYSLYWPTHELLMQLCVDKPAYVYVLTSLLAIVERIAVKEALTRLIRQHGADGDTLLHRTALSGNTGLVHRIVGLGAEVDAVNDLGNTALWLACFKGYGEVAETLLDAGADVNKTNHKGNPPLLGPCQTGPVALAETLLARGANPNIYNQNGDTMILICCRRGQPEVMRLLLSKADPAVAAHIAKIDGFSAVLASTEADRPECIKVLKEYGVDMEQKTADDNEIIAGATSLHLAAYYGRVASATTLLALGANVNARNVYGQTPLHIAVMQGQTAIVKLLREHRADQTISDRHGNTALAYARNEEMRRCMNDPLLEVLVKLARGEFGASQAAAVGVLAKNATIPGVLSAGQVVDPVSADGSTPLLIATTHGNLDVVDCLRRLGANPRLTNQYGMDAATWAEWIGNPRMRNLINAPADSTAIERLRKASAISSRDAMVLYYGTMAPSTYEVQKSNLYSRMNQVVEVNHVVDLDDVFEVNTKEGAADGSVIAANAPVLKVLEAQVEGLGVTDQLKWNTKMFAVNLIGGGKTTLSPQQVACLHLYDHLGWTLNGGILSGHISGAARAYTAGLLDAWARLPAYTGETYVGVTSVNRAAFDVGREFTAGVFVSTSSMWRVAVENAPEFTSKKKGVVMIIHSKTGRSVHQYSPFAYEMEVVFRPGTKFRVVNWYRGDVICLGQANIRQHTFGVDDELKPRMASTDAALIVEIAEL